MSQRTLGRIFTAVTSLLLLVCATTACGPSGDDFGDVGVFQTTDAHIRKDASSRDAGPEDVDTSTDQGPTDGPVAADVDSGKEDGGIADVYVDDIGTPEQTGPVIVTEYLANGQGAPEWIEVHNPGSTSVSLVTYRLQLDSNRAPNGGALRIFAVTDPDGDFGDQVVLEPGAYMAGYPNPSNSSSIPAEAAFVFGLRGTPNDVIDESQDVISIFAPAALSDRVDIRRVASDGSAVGLVDFPHAAGRSTQLSDGITDPTENDAGSLWCANLFVAPTPGARNVDCGRLVINEVLYDFASFSGGNDRGHEFIELLGAPGAPLGNVSLAFVEGNDPPGKVKRTLKITGTRMPMTGVYVVADNDGSGHTGVGFANQIASLDLENGGRAGESGDAIQVLRSNPNDAETPTLLDAFGYGPLPQGLVDATYGLNTYYGSPVPDLVTEYYSANWARDAVGTNTRNNLRDFHLDPSPTPGAVNLPSETTITAIDPDNAVATVTATVVISGTDFTDLMTAHVGTTVIDDCRPSAENQLTCVVPYEGPRSPAHVSVTVTTRQEHGESATLRDGFTWNASNNETGVTAEADYCVLQFPRDPISTTRGKPTTNIYGQIFEQGVTTAVSGQAAPGIMAHLGYGPVDVDPTTSNAWHWQTAKFNHEDPSHRDNDEYMGALTIAVPGQYAFTFRFSLDGGLTWTYCDENGAGSNQGVGFNPNNIGLLTVE
ncbi:MAG: lamin tail domain-containing protein [Deltaproteobacteria bacterium]|nr:lamin tail domain-containing protein [Deltaproteobacteria bacterium]